MIVIIMVSTVIQQDIMTGNNYDYSADFLLHYPLLNIKFVLHKFLNHTKVIQLFTGHHIKLYTMYKQIILKNEQVISKHRFH